jgi:hypothetical protein
MYGGLECNRDDKCELGVVVFNASVLWPVDLEHRCDSVNSFGLDDNQTTLRTHL